MRLDDMSIETSLFSITKSPNVLLEDMIMKIKVICTPIYTPEDYSIQVNTALAEGWTLIRQKIVKNDTSMPSESMLYAALILPDAPVEPEKPANLMEAMRMIHAECVKYNRCSNCPLYNICDNECPDRWRIGYAEEGGQDR